MKSNEIETFAYAKINLGLAILEKRTDGYHEIQSVMQSIGLKDRVKVCLTEGGHIECHCGVLSGSGNLAYRAAELFLRGLSVQNGVRIRIDKRIPVQAGLAGGSSDAAATLRAMNQLFNLPYSREELYELAKRIGADVAFCLGGGTQWATGVGGDLSPLPSAPKMDLVIVKPPEGVSTAEAYRIFDLEGKSHPLNREIWRDSLLEGDISEIISLLINDLEQASIKILPIIKEIKDELLEKGCLATLMSGSGSAVFGIVDSSTLAHVIAEQFRSKGYDSWVTQTIERGTCNE